MSTRPNPNPNLPEQADEHQAEVQVLALEEGKQVESEHHDHQREEHSPDCEEQGKGEQGKHANVGLLEHRKMESFLHSMPGLTRLIT